jgi:hypothetical protein
MRSGRLFKMIFLLFLPALARPAEPDAVVKKYSRYCEYKDGRLLQTDSVAIQIIDRNGEGACTIGIPFKKGNPISGFRAWIEDREGHLIREIKRQDYTDLSAIADYSLYEDHLMRKFTLKHNEYPYTINYTYTETTRQFLTITRWSPAISATMPTEQAILILKCPKEYPVHISEKEIDPPKVQETGSDIVREWKASFKGSLAEEVFGPPLEDCLPTVMIVPLHFQYGLAGSTADWKSFGNWQADLIQGLTMLPESEKEKISSLIGENKDKREVIKNLYHYMQDNTRYINVSIDIGGFRPYPAGYVALNRFGDCKALTNYMMALLDCAGIKSYYTLVYLGEQPGELLTSLPSPQFNHAILAVPLNMDTLWLENTNNTAPFGYIGTSIQNRKALLIEKGNSRLVSIPAIAQQDVRGSRHMEFDIDINGNAKTSLRFQFRGYYFELYNSLITQYSREIQNTYIHDHLPFTSFELEEWKITKKYRDARQLVLDAQVSVPKVLRPAGNDHYIALQPAEIPAFEPPGKRQLPVQLPYPVCVWDTLVYHLPGGGSKTILPSNTVLENKYGVYRIQFSEEGQTITVRRDFMLYPGTINHEEYPAFYSFLTAIKTDEKRKILIQQK